MTSPTPASRELARSILQWECRQGSATEEVAPAIERAFRRLHDVMSKLVGSAGYGALLLRAVHLSKHEHRWLESVVFVAAPFAFVQLEEHVRAVGPEPAMEAAVTLLATLLELFCSFIGEGLSLRQVDQVWSELPSRESAELLPKETK